MSSTIASFFSSFVPTIHADAPPSEEQPVKAEVVEKADSEVAENADPEVVEKVVADDAEEDEPEDVRVFNAHHS